MIKVPGINSSLGFPKKKTLRVGRWVAKKPRNLVLSLLVSLLPFAFVDSKITKRRKKLGRGGRAKRKKPEW